MSQLPREIRTERLLLRPWGLADAAAVFAYASDPQFARFLPLPRPYLEHHAEQFVAASVLADWNLHAQFAIEFGGEVVGDINLRIDHSRAAGDVGYGISPRYWGRGIVTEALRAILRHAFGDLELAKVSATADAENAGSWRVMEKAGMQREGLMRSHRVLRGERRDVVLYGILAAEFDAHDNPATACS